MQAPILRQETFTFTSGKKQNFHRGKKFIYPTEFKRPENQKELSKSNPLQIAQSDTKHLGLSLEATPKFARTGHIAFPYRYNFIKHFGERVVHRIKDGDRWEVSATTPIFGLVNSSGSTFLSPGSETLLGVHAGLRPDGSPDPEVRLLFFIQAH